MRDLTHPRGTLKGGAAEGSDERGLILPRSQIKKKRAEFTRRGGGPEGEKKARSGKGV